MISMLNNKLHIPCTSGQEIIPSFAIVQYYSPIVTNYFDFLTHKLDHTLRATTTFNIFRCVICKLLKS